MSKFSKLANSTLTFARTLTTKIDPNTGNEIPDSIEEYVARAYIKREKEKRAYEENFTEGVNVDRFKIVGYTVGILPDWCKLPTDPQIKMSIDNLGSGYFTFEGKIHVVYDKISKKGQTTPIQGWFVLQGSGESQAGYV